MACRPGHPFFSYVINNLNSYTGYHEWNDILHATGPYMLTQLFKKYSATSKEDQVRLAHPIQFEPSVDYSMLDHMKEKCLHQNNGYMSSELLKTHQQLCTRILGMSFTEKLGPESYTDHHWTHLWAGVKYDPWGAFNYRVFFNVSSITV